MGLKVGQGHLFAHALGEARVHLAEDFVNTSGGEIFQLRDFGDGFPEVIVKTEDATVFFGEFLKAPIESIPPLVLSFCERRDLIHERRKRVIVERKRKPLLFATPIQQLEEGNATSARQEVCTVLEIRIIIPENGAHILEQIIRRLTVLGRGIEKGMEVPLMLCQEAGKLLPFPGMRR